MLISGSHAGEECQTEINFGVGDKDGGAESGVGVGGGGGGGVRGRDGLTIRAQRAHFTHTSSKPMGFALVAGKREKGGKKDFDFIWQPETPSHSHHQKKKE